MCDALAFRRFDRARNASRHPSPRLLKFPPRGSRSGIVFFGK